MSNMATEFLRGTNGFAFDFSKEAEYFNREEEIVQQAVKEFPRFAERRVGFITGAKWSDEHPRKGLVDIEKVKEFLSSVDLNFYRELEDKFNTDELIIDLERYLEK